MRWRWGQVQERHGGWADGGLPDAVARGGTLKAMLRGEVLFWGRRLWITGRGFPARCQAFWRRFVARVGWALCASPARVASPVGGASWLGEPGLWGTCACLVMGRGFWQGTPEEAHPAWVTLPENQVLRRFGPPAPYLPPLSSSQWCLVRASARRWGLVGTSLSAYWPLFAGLCRVLSHCDTYRRND